MDLSGKNFLITGAGGFGVGEGICRAITKYGGRLIINERSLAKAEAAARNYPDAYPVEADISDYKAVKRMFDLLRREVGVVHGLVNNAGIGLSKMSHKAIESDFDGVYNVDMKGVWMVSKFFVHQLLSRKYHGNIVNVSSVHSKSTIPGYAIYASAKSAVEGFTRGMAVELGKHNIRVNAIAPGYVHAEQNYSLIKTWAQDPENWVEGVITKEQVLNHAIQPEDCGHLAAFLLSELSRSITGQTIVIDAGNTIKLFSGY